MYLDQFIPNIFDQDVKWTWRFATCYSYFRLHLCMLWKPTMQFSIGTAKMHLQSFFIWEVLKRIVYFPCITFLAPIKTSSCAAYFQVLLASFYKRCRIALIFSVKFDSTPICLAYFLKNKLKKYTCMYIHLMLLKVLF